MRIEIDIFRDARAERLNIPKTLNLMTRISTLIKDKVGNKLQLQMRFILLLLCPIVWLGCNLTPHQKDHTFITPHYGKIVVRNISQFDSLFPLSFAGYEGLYHKVCDTTVSPCCKFIPCSEYSDALYQQEYADAAEILDKVGQLPVDYLLINFYMGQQDSTVMKLLRRSYGGQGYELTVVDSVVRPQHYSNDVLERTLYGKKDMVKYKLCKYGASTENGLVSQIKIFDVQ